MEGSSSDLTDYFGQNDSQCPTEPLGSSSECRQLIHPTQEAIAKIIEDRILMRIDLSKFTSMGFQIYMPNKV